MYDLPPMIPLNHMVPSERMMFIERILDTSRSGADAQVRQMTRIPRVDVKGRPYGKFVDALTVGGGHKAIAASLLIPGSVMLGPGTPLTQAAVASSLYGLQMYSLNKAQNKKQVPMKGKLQNAGRGTYQQLLKESKKTFRW